MYSHLRQRILLVCLMAGLCLCRPWPAVTQPVDTTDTTGAQIYGFGLHLFQLGDYYRAITELKRFTLLFPQHPQYSAAQILLGLALQEDSQYEEAADYLQRLERQQDDVALVAAFKLGELHFVQRHYSQAAQHFQSLLATVPESPFAARSTYLLGLSLALEGQVERAQRVLTRLPAEHDFTRQALALQDELRTITLPEEKSPQLAGVLSGILPGAGHLYVGKPLHAIGAFVLNGLFLTGAAYAFHEGLEATAGILLFFEVGWYLGTINSAIQEARHMNHNARQAVTEHLRATYAPAPLGLRDLQTPVFGLRFTF